MKILTTILIFVIIFYLTYSILAQNDINDNNFNRENIEPTAAFDETTGNLMRTEEEDPLNYDPDIFLRKLDQKKLPPLTGKEKIIWSFRLADKNPFL